MITKAISFVMPGLVPGIHAFHAAQTWMAGTSPAMTQIKAQANADAA
jgi:hypothetical protein